MGIYGFKVLLIPLFDFAIIANLAKPAVGTLRVFIFYTNILILNEKPVYENTQAFQENALYFIEETLAVITPRMPQTPTIIAMPMIP